MTRSLQHRDISEPIERIVREHLNSLNVAAINHGPLARELVSEMNDVVKRALREGYDLGRADEREGVAEYDAIG